MVAADLVSLVLLPLALGLMGFIEPCSIGTSLLFIRYVEGGDAATKVAQVAIFALTRALVAGVLGGVAALVGSVLIGVQKAGWVLLGAVYVALGVLYLAGRAGALTRTLGPGLGRLGSGNRGAAALAVLFGLNIPACAAPLLAVVLGGAAVTGPAAVARGFVPLAVFGLALSLPLALAVLWPAARRALDRASAASGRVPLLIGLVLVGLGLWSIWFGLFVTPHPS
jgi:cytochrome c-type biogenesis protein